TPSRLAGDAHGDPSRVYPSDVAPALNRLFARVQPSVGQGFFVPVPELPLEIPKLHGTDLAPTLGDCDRGLVIRGFELAVMVNVTTETMHEIQAVITHRHNPRPR